MELSSYIIWNAIITLVLGPILYSIRQNANEAKRLDILLNKTREDYAKRDDVTVSINRLEEKIDRILEKIK